MVAADEAAGVVLGIIARGVWRCGSSAGQERRHWWWMKPYVWGNLRHSTVLYCTVLPSRKTSLLGTRLGCRESIIFGVYCICLDLKSWNVRTEIESDLGFSTA